MGWSKAYLGLPFHLHIPAPTLGRHPPPNMSLTRVVMITPLGRNEKAKAGAGMRE